ncbi:MAG: response regulator transcription factor [Ilumatobacteraceae bacterium]
MIAVFASSVSPELARSLDLAGYAWKAVASADEAAEHEPADGWQAAIIDLSAGAEPGWAFARLLRKNESAPVRVLVLVGGGHIADLEHRDELFDDFCLAPFHPTEFEARLRHVLWSPNGLTASRADLVEYGELVLNLETYQATITRRPLDLTYMEYELLKFLAQNPGKVFTREILLSRVWGYEYYGGARTVDVHIRRLRAKLGEEHAGLIATVRSVGYRFGQSRWGA